MIEYSHQNTIAFGYGSEKLIRKTENNSFRYFFSSCGTALSFKEECYGVARLIRDKAAKLGRKIYVLQSGGMDCEVMIRAFIDQQIDICTITFRLGGLNAHELKYATEFVKQHKLDHEIYDIDFRNWLPTQEQLFHDTCSESPFMLCHMKLLSHIWAIGGMPVIGAGDVLLNKIDGRWMFSKQEFMTPLYWHMSNNAIDGVPAFFSWTPEILLSMLQEPRIARLGSGEDTLANKLLTDARQLKYKIYREHWPDLVLRQKYTGEERITNFTMPLRQKWIANRKLSYLETWTCAYKDVCLSLM